MFSSQKLSPFPLSRPQTRGVQAWLLAGALLTGCVHSPAHPVSLVRDGQASGVVVVSDHAHPLEREAVAHFTRTVEESTGVRLPVVDEAAADTYPEGIARLYVGDGRASAAAGITLPADAVETYRIATRGRDIYIIGRDERTYWRSAGVRSRPVLWALNRLLEEALGVRWLWPGELGTHIPARTDFAIQPLDLTYQPDLMIRWLRVNLHRAQPLASIDPELNSRITAEASAWLENHLVGRRGQVSFGHAFTHWWDAYAAEHPDYFAVPPEGVDQRPPRWVKLRLSNPDVIERIAAEYEQAGAPEYYNVCPNDGSGFGVSEAVRAWDIPADQPVMDIWLGRANLTARYVKFWNRLYERLSTINPDVKMATYAYSAYREPPPPERPLRARMFIGIVDTYDNYDGWSGWSDSGSEMMLRPNWWFQGGNAPYIPLHRTADFVRFAADNGMKALDMDSILGYWSTQGINYYLVARLMTRPELSTEEIIGEYTSAFGPAADDIRTYLSYWEDLTDVYNYPMNATGGLRQESVQSRYEDLVREGKIPHSILNGSKYVLPYLYGEEVILPAEDILYDALTKVEAGSLYAARIAYLQAGLDELRVTRDQIALGQQLKKNRDPSLLQTFKDGSQALEAFREHVAGDHVVWPQTVRWHEDRYRVLIRPEHLDYHQVELDGL